MRILIINLHSALNLGDESIMRGTLKLLKKKYRNAKFILMANHPESWKIIPNVNIVPSLINYLEKPNNILTKAFRFLEIIIKLLLRKKQTKNLNEYVEINKVIAAINQADIIYSCGGGNFYSNTLIGSNLVINLITLAYAGILKKKIIMLPQSFGPFNNKFHKFLVKFALKYPQKIFVRESLSHDLLTSIGVEEEKLFLLPDLALSLPTAKKKIIDINLNNINIGITIINRGAQSKSFSNQLKYQHAIMDYIKYLISKKMFTISLLVQCFGPSDDQDDEIITSSIYKEFKPLSQKIYLQTKYKDSSSLITDISKMDLIVATRMHTAIFGLINYLPTLLIGYQPKSEGLFNLFDMQEYYVDIKNIDPDFLISKTENIIQNYPNIQGQIFKKISQLNSIIKKEIVDNT